jgi:hypothetical protein
MLVSLLIEDALTDSRCIIVGGFPPRLKRHARLPSMLLSWT